jgi:CTP synthase (UTP-ammonia lyase)
MPDAEHEETAPQSSTLIIRKMVCSLVGKSEPIKIVLGTLAYRSYGKETSTEQFCCSYGLNPDYLETIARSGLNISAVGPDGEARIAELSGRRFFLATLFLPQLSSTAEEPHPLITAYLKAALEYQTLADGSILRK